MTRLMVMAIAMFSLCFSSIAQTVSPAKPLTANCSAMLNFNGGDVWAAAADADNLYVALAWCKYMVAIDKKTGELSKIEAKHDIQSVAVASGVCYYYVATEGLYSYNPKTKTSSGPLFGLKPYWDDFSQIKMAVSPDGMYLFCAGQVVNLPTSSIVGTLEGGSDFAINNLGGVYIGTPAAAYAPLGQAGEVLSDKVVVHSIFFDKVTNEAYFSCEQGVGTASTMPTPESGLQRVKGLQDLNIDCINRDDNGNFLFGLRNGLGIGGKNITDNIQTYTPVSTGIMSGSLNLHIGGARVLIPDGQGNIVAASGYDDCLVIINPMGLKGYEKLKGKAIRY